MFKKLISILLVAAVLAAVPYGAAFASPSEGQEQVIYMSVAVPYFDIWKHSDGHWQDTNGDTYPDRPTEGKLQVNSYYLPDESVRNRFKVTRVEAVPLLLNDRDLYDRAYQYDKHWGDWAAVNKRYLRYEPDNLTVRAYFDEQSLAHGACSLVWRASLSPMNAALDLTNPKVRAMLGLPPMNFAPGVQGWRWYFPAVITWYGVPKQVPDFYAKIDPHSVKAKPGQELTFTATFGLKENYPLSTRAVLKGLHVIGGKEYPVTLVPLDGAPDPKNPIEFQPGQQFKYRVKVHAQNRNSDIVVKINPVDTSNDANWSNNRDEARISVLVDVAVKIWPIKNPYVLSWLSSSLTPGVNVRAYRKDDGDPVPVKLTMNGPAGTKTLTFTLGGKGFKTVQYFFTVTRGGTWTVSAEAWPEPKDLESYPPDNRASTQVTVVKREPPPTGPREPGIHGELGDI